MIVRVSDPDPALAARLAAFEASFTYPLGAAGRFSISHAPSYDRFFAAMGGHCCLAALRDDRVVATIGAARRRLRLTDGSLCEAVYLGDLKITPDARGGPTLVRLARALAEWAQPCTTAFAVVMGGTTREPPAYTGRAGIPPFAAVADIAVLRLATAAFHADDAVQEIDAPAFDAVERRLSLGRITVEVGDAKMRSALTPRRLALGDAACGMVEDTARAKRLLDDRGDEIRTAHCSALTYRDPDSGARLLATAAAHAATAGLPALFAAVPISDAAAFARALGPHVESFPARVFANGLPAGADWIIASSEI